LNVTTCVSVVSGVCDFVSVILTSRLFMVVSVMEH
jgi:hypothetical protein